MEGLKICLHCGFTWSEFKSRRLLGCASCYVSFAEELKPLLLEVHGILPEEVQTHSVFVPEQASQYLLEWNILKEKIALAIHQENYEEAQRLKLIMQDWEKQYGHASR